ncbi:GTPase domain-containing protein [Massilia sp. P8910]|uniref:GTP-binding protein n=1 Tax=Massilia antarctica TaxID=2765360 RepID=UPI001E54B82B|nr:GTPase domain-containing protein [Massilia antarctica]MCE3603801.1 GTPase domain-containing protein [Massilia antarctica]
MAQLDERAQRLTVKLVYYGPALSGKTSNLTRLHDLLTADRVGDMMLLETEGDRTLFFDLLPLGFTAPSGLLVTFKLFTVPGQVAHNGTRKAVLSRADGAVFVADSQYNQAVNNGASFDNLMANAATVGIDVASFPLVVQYNKRDLPDILSEEDLAHRWSKAPWPVLLASALQGDGVRETFSALLKQVYARLDLQFALLAEHGLSQDVFIKAAGGELA